MSLLKFMPRLAALVPRSRLQLIRFNGVLAANAGLRASIEEPAVIIGILTHLGLPA